MRLDGLLRVGLVFIGLSQGAAVAASFVSANLLAITFALTGLALELTMLCSVRWLRLWWLNWWRGWILRDEARAATAVTRPDGQRVTELRRSGGAA